MSEPDLIEEEADFLGLTKKEVAKRDVFNNRGIKYFYLQSTIVIFLIALFLGTGISGGAIVALFIASFPVSLFYAVKSFPAVKGDE